MPAELENVSVIFTDEAEAAIKKSLARWERRLRARALDEAVRTRGVPAEVTASDIERAANRLGNRKYIASRGSERFLAHGPRDYEILEAFRNSGPDEARRNRRQTFSSLLAKVYIWLGITGTIAGILYAPILHRYKTLSADPSWRFGLLVAAAGLCMFGIGLAFKVFLSRVRSAPVESPRRSKP